MTPLNELWLKVLALLPITLIVGITYQFINLEAIDRLAFFSWTQVINDTVVLLMPTGLCLLWFFLWTYIDLASTWKKFLLDVFLMGTICITLGLVSYSFLPPILSNSYNIWAVSGFFIPLFLYFRILLGSEKSKDKNLRIILQVCMSIVSLVAVFSQIREAQYKNLYIEIREKPEKLIYMNDCYLFTSSKVLHNHDGTIVQTGPAQHE